MIDNRDETLLHQHIIWSPWGDGPGDLYNPIRITDRETGLEWLRRSSETVDEFRWRVYDELVVSGLVPSPSGFPLMLIQHHGAEIVSLSNPSKVGFQKESV